MTNVPRRSDVKRADRALSKLLFGGARYRLEVGAAIADTADGVVSTPGLVDELSLVAQSVNQELRIMERAGLLSRLDIKGREVYFTREPSQFWDFCREAHAAADSMLHRGSPW